MDIYCPICNNLKPNPDNKTCSRQCATKYQWQCDDGSRKESNRKRFIGNKFSKGRPKGSKNKQPYPIHSEKVIERNKNTSINMKERIGLMTSEERLQHFGNYFNSSPETIKKCKKQAIKNVLEGNSLKGRFKPKNPKKYSGDPTNIIYRSSWELKFFMFLDSDPRISKWSSEELFIPYRSPIDGKVRRYFPDVIYTTTENKTVMVEIKPKYQTQPPLLNENKKKSRKYMNEVITWGINSAKWDAAKEYCQDRKWEFVIITEYELGIKK